MRSKDEMKSVSLGYSLKLTQICLVNVNYILRRYCSRHSNTVVGNVTITRRRAIQPVAPRDIQSRLVRVLLFLSYSVDQIFRLLK